MQWESKEASLRVRFFLLRAPDISGWSLGESLDTGGILRKGAADSSLILILLQYSQGGRLERDCTDPSR